MRRFPALDIRSAQTFSVTSHFLSWAEHRDNLRGARRKNLHSACPGPNSGRGSQDMGIVATKTTEIHVAIALDGGIVKIGVRSVLGSVPGSSHLGNVR